VVNHPHYVGGIFLKNEAITGSLLNLYLSETQSVKSLDYCDVIDFEKFRFQHVLRPHQTAKPALSSFSGLKSGIENLRFRVGLVWTEGLTVEIKLRFQISPVWPWMGPKG